MKVYNRKGDLLTSFECPYNDCPQHKNYNAECWNDTVYPDDWKEKIVDFMESKNRQLGLPEEFIELMNAEICELMRQYEK